ncbi:carbohydrate binding family 9 domain-containing protein [bacterium]|nr:carbohydrate binding family 9 domain-containing protein [bacterium]
MYPRPIMSLRTHILIFILLLVIPSLAAGVSHHTTTKGRGFPVDSKNKRVIMAQPISNPPKIDGNLRDSIWKSVDFQDQFLQREPNEGAPASEKTAVGICYDNDNIYFGIRCFDSNPDGIIAREMRRDARIDDDDFFELILDTYHDQRSGFYFIINPNGVKRDAMLADEGRQYNSSWDGVWQCRTQINNEGWFAEIAIPWKTLRFASADTAIWGINFARTIRRKNEHVFWQLIPRDVGMSGLFRLSEAGDLYNLKDLQMGGNIELKPYIIGGIQNDPDTDFSNKTTKDFGLDAKIALTGNLSLDLTVNTDFAQVESDQERVNLSRFSLYFPEKREFFLEGAEVFSFGAGRGSGRGGGGMNLFYSRRIGIVDGHEARILGGAKMVGKIGNFQVGMLNMITDETEIIETDTAYTAPRTNFSVLRLRRDIGGRGSLGLMMLNKDALSGDKFNRAMGLDLYLPLNRFWTVSAYLAGAFDSDETWSSERLSTRENLAGNLGIRYRADLWRFNLSYTDIGARFSPEMGYMRRVDYRYTESSIEYAPRPAYSAIRQISYRLNGRYRSDHDNRLLDSSIGLSGTIHFQNSSRLTMGMQRKNEFLDFEWEVRPGFLIPINTYEGWSYYIWGQTDQSRRLAGRLNVNYSTYFTGNNLRTGANGSITLIPRTRFEVDYNYNHVSLPQGVFSTHTGGLRAFYFINTELFLKAYVQVKDDALYYGGQEKVVANLVLRWIYSPGSNFYLVYNEGRLMGNGGDEILNRTFMAKATFFWRK